MGNSCCSDSKTATNRDTLPQLKDDPKSRTQAKLDKKKKKELYKKGQGPTAEALSNAYLEAEEQDQLKIQNVDEVYAKRENNQVLDTYGMND